MSHVQLDAIGYHLPDGRALLHDVSLRVGEGSKTALVGPNGTGKTTLLRIIAGDADPHDGAVTRGGQLGVMRQFIGSVRDDSTVRDLLLSVAPDRIRRAAEHLDRAELALMECDSEQDQIKYAQALADWADVGGYEFETQCDVHTTAALGIPYELARFRGVNTLSGGQQKRLVLESLLGGPHQVLLLDEPDNYLDVPAKRWLEERLVGSPKTILFVSHDRELINRAAGQIATLEPTRAGSTLWVHPGSFTTYHQARADRNAKLAELRPRWDEQRAALRDLVLMYRQKAAYNSDMASRLQAAETRLRRFDEAGPPEAVPLRQNVRMRLAGGRTAKRAVIAENLELTGLTRPFDTELWYGDRVAVLGGNGTGKSHFLRLLACGGTDPELDQLPVGDMIPEPVNHDGRLRLGARVRPGWFAQTHHHAGLMDRTLLDILHHGDERRAGHGREQASRILDRYGLAPSAEQTFGSLSGGQQGRFQILLLELMGSTLLLLDEPTDNLDLHSAEALEDALAAFDGTVIAVTHDRWFARTFTRFLIFGEDGKVRESVEPQWV
ncbi:ATP-binding cassette domain-containing protein [Mycobacteroides abscessus]|uniref:ABC-F family ATP-binding cassette domain-containing protein n=1 Tax=Mycobacteroides abscessus TaxID=36809 RepID=UPI0009A7BBE6|nr:ATP-binding cassette domain-containing protein [Mycobacteroides abscessus]MDM2238711.1 ATP-binding cassette domain-containing protein [Mycobacteroides abscessus]MDM2248331.1 ATP-binding cassette domain-containing protein [Mycobacteroides abscessus]MDM2256408.1 ATP-binding cassette domain-containing protein [Mycobacteroides abscessus]MDM2262815.1 ATP-binding cassette domain-containing protein [Mycobacteroides abscessus]MDM2267721.1 ATP-binding cassette domain-containing protein [Mycobacteroi